MTERIQDIADLLQETAHAHHQAFIETDGLDPEWPLWYADYLKEKLSALLEARFTMSELVYLMVWADKVHRRDAPDAEWTSYYAELFLEQYA